MPVVKKIRQENAMEMCFKLYRGDSREVAEEVIVEMRRN